MQYHLCQADFGENEPEGDAEQPPVPADDDDGDDPDGADDDGIPLNESHPGLVNADGGLEEEADDDEDPAAGQPPVQPADRAAAEQPVQLQAEQVDAEAQIQLAVRGEAQRPVQLQGAQAQPQDDGMLPGGSQLVPGNSGTTGQNGVARRQPKRAAAASASAIWASAGPSTSRPRFN